MGRAPCCEKVGLKRGRWTKEEDQILANYIAEHGEGSWRSLPKNAGLLRCGKSCRLRWINYLRADVKRGNISKEEEDVIIKLHATLGNRWSLIASHLPGRTDNEIKNYWNSHLSRQIHTYRRKYTAGPDTAPIAIAIDMSKLHSAERRRGGRTPGRSPKSATSSSSMTKSKQPDTEHSDGARSAVVDPDLNQPNSSSSGSTGEGEDATGPWVLDPIELGDLWEAESEMDALMSIGGAAHDSATAEGFDAAQAQVDDLFDDMDWDNFAAHLWGEPEQQTDHSAQPQPQQAAEPIAAAAAADDAAAEACDPDEHELEALEAWLLSDSF